MLKQQGHFYDVSALAFSPDGSYIASGADDNKARLEEHCNKDPSLPQNVMACHEE